MENIFIYKIILRIYIENIFICALEIILFNIYTKNAYNKLIYIKNNNNAIYYLGHLLCNIPRKKIEYCRIDFQIN